MGSKQGPGLSLEPFQVIWMLGCELLWKKKRKNNDNNNETFSLLSMLLIQALYQVWITIKHFCIQQLFPRSSEKLVAWEPGCTEMEPSNSCTISPLHPK